MAENGLTDVDLLALDYDAKVKMPIRLEFASVSGRYAELRANITVLKEVKSALQSAIRAEGVS
jgi:hypothetical protein